MTFIVDFLKYLTYEKRYSPYTISAYNTDIYQYISFCKISKDTNQLATISHMTIRLWIVFMLQNGISSRSVNRKITSLKSFYNFLIKRDILNFNPVDKVIKPKFQNPLPNTFSTKKILHLINSTKFSEKFTDQRDKIILELLFDTGMRLAELKKLKHEDFDITSKTVKIIGKGKKERIIPITDTLLKSIKKYIDLKSATFPTNNSAYLIVTNKGKESYNNLIYRCVKKWLSYAAKNGKISPHIIRHSFATSLLNNGADINAIKSLLGHSSLAATQVYTHHSFEKIKNTYNQAHPKA